MVRVLRVVAVASRTGLYGGPFDTATRQSELLPAANLQARLVAGYLRGDLPDVEALAPGRYARVWRLFARRGFVAVFSSAVARAVFSEVRAAHVVHISFARELIPLWAAIVALVSGVPVILQPHGMMTARTSRGHKLIDRFVARPIYRRAAAVIALSAVEARDLGAWGGTLAQVAVLGNPLPTSIPAAATPRSLPKARSEIRIVFVARLHPRKRVADFVAAAATAAAAGFEWRWIVVGPDEGDGDLVRRAAAVNSRLEYRGAVSADQVVAELSEATVFAMPSEREPWGNVLASAIALGIPSVVTNSSALAPAITEFGAGRVTPDHDPRSLLEAVTELLDATRFAAASAAALRMRDSLLDRDALRRRLNQVVMEAASSRSARGRLPGTRPPAERRRRRG